MVPSTAILWIMFLAFYECSCVMLKINTRENTLICTDKPVNISQAFWEGFTLNASELNEIAANFRVPDFILTSSHYRCFLEPKPQSRSKRQVAGTTQVEEGNCPPGYRIDQNKCFPCFPGSYTSGQETECFLCPKNFFNNKEAADSCWPCPSGSTTLKEGADSEDMCVDEHGQHFGRHLAVKIFAALLIVFIVCSWIVICVLLYLYLQRSEKRAKEELVESGEAETEDDNYNSKRQFSKQTTHGTAAEQTYRKSKKKRLTNKTLSSKKTKRYEISIQGSATMTEQSSTPTDEEPMDYIAPEWGDEYTPTTAKNGKENKTIKSHHRDAKIEDQTDDNTNVQTQNKSSNRSKIEASADYIRSTEGYKKLRDQRMSDLKKKRGELRHTRSDTNKVIDDQVVVDFTKPTGRSKKEQSQKLSFTKSGEQNKGSQANLVNGGNDNQKSKLPFLFQQSKNDTEERLSTESLFWVDQEKEQKEEEIETKENEEEEDILKEITKTISSKDQKSNQEGKKTNESNQTVGDSDIAYVLDDKTAEEENTNSERSMQNAEKRPNTNESTQNLESSQTATYGGFILDDKAEVNDVEHEESPPNEEESHKSDITLSDENFENAETSNIIEQISESKAEENDPNNEVSPEDVEKHTSSKAIGQTTKVEKPQSKSVTNQTISKQLTGEVTTGETKEVELKNINQEESKGEADAYSLSDLNAYSCLFHKYFSGEESDHHRPVSRGYGFTGEKMKHRNKASPWEDYSDLFSYQNPSLRKNRSNESSEKETRIFIESPPESEIKMSPSPIEQEILDNFKQNLSFTKPASCPIHQQLDSSPKCHIEVVYVHFK